MANPDLYEFAGRVPPRGDCSLTIETVGRFRAHELRFCGSHARDLFIVSLRVADLEHIVPGAHLPAAALAGPGTRPRIDVRIAPTNTTITLTVRSTSKRPRGFLFELHGETLSDD